MFRCGSGLWLILIKIALMLSFPYSLSSISSYLQINQSNNSYKILESSWPLFILLSTNFSISLGDFSSHIPSHPINMYSMSSKFYSWIYGNDITICFRGGNLLFLLKSKSPIDRDTFKHPFIRPYSFTHPPAFKILSFYWGEFGTCILLRLTKDPFFFA